MSSSSVMSSFLTMSETVFSSAGTADEIDASLRMDEDAFRAFYERTARPVWAYLMRLTGDPHTADDLLQEAYYRFYHAAANHESESHRRNSLFRIATNLARDLGRHQRRHPETAMPEDTADHHRHGNQMEHRTDLKRPMPQLKPEQQALLWLAYGQGFSHDEIAGVIGVKRGDVKTLLYRTRQKLAGLLRKGGGNRG